MGEAIVQLEIPQPGCQLQPSGADFLAACRDFGPNGVSGIVTTLHLYGNQGVVKLPTTHYANSRRVKWAVTRG